MKRISLAVGIIVAGACSGEKPVDPDNGKTCTVACGVGFACEEARCVLAPETVVEAVLLSPVADAWLNEPEVTFECRVKAPQVGRVFVRVTGEGAEPSEVALEKVAAQDSWTATQEIGEGSLSAVCVVEFGPAGATVLHESEAVAFRVAVGGPRVILNPVEGWFGEDAVVEVSASQDPGVEIKSARLEVPSVALLVVGDREGALGWRFPVKVLSLTREQVETEFPFDVYFEDPAGNEAKASSVIKVDTIKPRPTIVVDSTWLQADGTAAVTVTVVDGSDVESVSLSIEGKSFAGVRSGSGWKFSLALGDVVDAVTQGSVSFIVAAVDAAGNVGSAEGALLVDGVAPSLELEPLNAWYRRDSTLTVRANITEGGGINPASVVLRMGEGQFPGTDDGEGAWVFEVPLAEVTDADIEALVDFSVAAADLAGNVTVESFQVGVDAKPPTVNVTGSPDTTWRGPGNFNFTASLGASGAPVVHARLSGAGGNPAVERSGAESNLSLLVNIATWTTGEFEGTVPWSLVVTDAAGNEAVVSGSFLIDVKAPVIVLNTPRDWFGSATVEVSPTITDGGSGLSLADVEWEASGLSGKCVLNGTIWKCPVATPQASGFVSSTVPFAIRAKDSVGNLRVADNDVLKVDKKGPELSFVSDGSWYNRSQVVVVKANASDEHSGLVAGTPTLRILSPLASTHSGTNTGGVLTFNVPANQVVAAGETSGDARIELSFADRLGNHTTIASTGLFKVDDTAPTISTEVRYPAGRQDVAIRDPFGDRAKVILRVTAADNGSGLSGVKVSRGGVDYPVSSVSGNVHEFVIDLSTFVGLGAGSTLSFAATAGDSIGKSVVANMSVAYTRKLWSIRHSTSAPIGSLALAGDSLYLSHRVHGATAPNLFSLSRKDGSHIWSSRLAGTPTTPVTVGSQGSRLLPVVGSDASGGTLSIFTSYQSGSDVPPFSTVTGADSRGALAFSTLAWSGVEGVDDAPVPTIFAVGENDTLRAYWFNCTPAGCGILRHQQSVSFPAASYWSTPAVRSDYVFVGSSDGRVGRANRWKFEVDPAYNMYVYRMSSKATPLESPNAPIHGLGLDIISNSWIAQPGAAYFHDYNLDPAGAVYSPHSGVTTMVVRGNDAMYFGAFAGGLYYGSGSKVEKSGAFTAAMKAAPVVGRLPTGKDELYLVEGTTFRALDAKNATSLWSLPTGGVMEVAPVLDCHGIAYVARADGEVQAYVTDSRGLSRSFWPRFQHDNRNTGDYSYKTWSGSTCID